MVDNYPIESLEDLYVKFGLSFDYVDKESRSDGEPVYTYMHKELIKEEEVTPVHIRLSRTLYHIHVEASNLMTEIMMRSLATGFSTSMFTEESLRNDDSHLESIELLSLISDFSEYYYILNGEEPDFEDVTRLFIHGL